MNTRYAMLLLLSLMVPAVLQGQEDRGNGAPQFGFDFALGVISFQDSETGEAVTYQQVAFQPDLQLGPFGVGLNLELNYRFTGGDGSEFEIREEDWIPSGNLTILDLYLPKINYARYGTKGEPIFMQFGTIPSATLGNGFIVDRYTNGLFRPQRRVFGGVIDLDGPLFGVPYAGFESLVGNMAAWDVLAGRVYVRPFAGTTLPVLPALQVGTTVAADRDPWYHVRRNPAPDNPYLSDDPPSEKPDQAALVWGADLRLPVIASPVFDMTVFADLIRQNGGTGGMAGASGRVLQFILYGAQARFLQDNVVPSYFDFTYDRRRAERYRIWSGEEQLTGGAGWSGELGFALPSDLLVFRARLEGPFSPGSTSGYPEVRGTVSLAEGAVPGFAGLSADAYYEKFNLESISDLTRAEDALIGARINVRTGPVIISLVYDLTYDPLADGDPWVVSAGLETVISF